MCNKDEPCIAIIDNGVNESYYSNIGPLKYNIRVLPDGTIEEWKNHDPYLYSHGTTCAAIIKTYAPSAIIASIKIINDTKKTTSKQLKRALEWCFENKIRIVNLSIGTTDFNEYYENYKMTIDAVKWGIFIIAAGSNKNIITYPAAFSNVIGVKCDRNLPLEKDEYIYNAFPEDGIDVVASSKHSLINCFGDYEDTQICNSFAAPLITAKVYELVRTKSIVSIDDVKKHLKEKGLSSFENFNLPIQYKNTDWIDCALIINIYQKGYKDILQYNFEVSDDIKIKCEDISNGFEKVNKLLDNYLQRDKFDTVILIVRDQFNDLDKVDINVIVEKLERNNINLVYINDYDKKAVLSEYNKIKVWYPTIHRYKNNNYNNKKDEIPIIIIYSISKEKMLYLVKRLQELFNYDNYRCTGIANAAMAALYGLEYLQVLPYSNFNIEAINNIIELYYSDLLILAINTEHCNKTILDQIEYDCENDIRIVIGELNNEEVTVFSKDGVENKAEKQKSFYGLSDKSIDDIYNYIVSLYEI